MFGYATGANSVSIVNLTVLQAINPPQRGAALLCFLLGLLYLSHSAAAFEIGPSFLIRGAGVAMGQQDLANRWTFPLPLGTWELAAGQECSGQKFSSVYCALCVLSRGSDRTAVVFRCYVFV